MKRPELRLNGVHYEENLEPFIERKLFSVNSGHATSAYTGAHFSANTILEALQNPIVKTKVESVLEEIRSLLIAKWGFDAATHASYIDKIIQRFQNKFISDAITRVARTPLRKLGYDERFIRPIREMQTYHLATTHLLAMVGIIFNYNDKNNKLDFKEKIKLFIFNFSLNDFRHVFNFSN